MMDTKQRDQWAKASNTYKERMKAKGYVQLNIWVPKGKRQIVKDLANELIREHEAIR